MGALQAVDLRVGLVVSGDLPKEEQAVVGAHCLLVPCRPWI